MSEQGEETMTTTNTAKKPAKKAASRKPAKKAAKKTAKKAVKKAAKKSTKKAAGKNGAAKAPRKPRGPSKVEEAVKLMLRKSGATLADFASIAFNQPAMAAVNAAKNRGYKVSIKKEEGERKHYFATGSAA